MDALQAHGVSQEQTDTLLAWADDFNARVTTPTLTEGFTAMEGDFVDYSSLLFDIKELPDGTFFMEANCRLTAFLLMRDQLQTCGTADESDTYLMFDIEAIDTQKEYQLSSEARADFITLFNAVPLEGAANQEEHLARIEEAWSERGIQVDSAKGMSLIEVYLHSPLDGVRFVGHTGVLMGRRTDCCLWRSMARLVPSRRPNLRAGTHWSTIFWPVRTYMETRRSCRLLCWKMGR